VSTTFLAGALLVFGWSELGCWGHVCCVPYEVEVALVAVRLSEGRLL